MKRPEEEGRDRRADAAPSPSAEAEAAGRAPRPTGLAQAAARRMAGGAGSSGAAVHVGVGFVILMAALGAANAVATDIVIPAQGRIASEFGLGPGEGGQWAILGMYLGAGLSQIALGPVADAWGRRRAAFLGLGLAMAGGLAAAAAPTFGWLVAGRVIQGLGTGGLRVVSLAMIRDRHSGDAMARVVASTTRIFEMIMFITPLIGQAILELGAWRWVLAVTVGHAAVVALALHFHQPESLRPEHRRAISPRAVAGTFAGILRERPALGAAMAMAAAFGAVATFLSSAQPILGGIYGLDWGVSLTFAAMSLCFAVAAVVNSRLIPRLGAARLARYGLTGWAVSGLTAWAVFAVGFAGVPPLWLYLVWLCPTLAMFGILYGNLLATALTPMGDRAGSASSVLSASGTLAGVALGAAMAEVFDGTVIPLAALLGLAGVAGLLAMRWGGLGRAA